MHGLRTGMRFVRDGTGREKMHVNSYAEVRQQFDAYRTRFNAGDATALLEALGYANSEGVPSPYWLALEVQSRIQRVFSEPVTLHTAFGLDAEFPARGKKAATSRIFMRHRQRLWSATSELMHKEGLRLDPALRRVLAEQAFPFGPTVARRQFEIQDAIQGLHLGKTRSTVGTKALSRKRPVPRKP